MPRWLIGLAVALGLLALLVAGAVSLIPSERELALRVSTALQSQLGVPVHVGALRWQLFPARVVLENIVTEQPLPVEIKQLTLYPDMALLWRRRLRIDHAELQGAVLAQRSVSAWHPAPSTATQDSSQPQSQPKSLPLPLDETQPLGRLQFKDVTWVSRYGTRVPVDGEADFDAHWRPRTASLRRPDFEPATDLTLTRQGGQDRWDIHINVGGGTAQGEVQLQAPAAGQESLRLNGTLKPKNIEVSSALAAFNRRAILAGKVSGDTTLSAQGNSLPELVRSLHTRTGFSMSQAKLLRFDVNKAIRSVGKDHAGSTALDSVTGQLDTQNTPQGMVLEFSRVHARSGTLSASGQARIAERRINAEFSVDLVDGLVGVPLKLSGPLDQVHVSVPASAVAGAVVGTAVLPGIGTAIGAKLGAALGRLFGTEGQKSSVKPKSPAPQPKR